MTGNTLDNHMRDIFLTILIGFLASCQLQNTEAKINRGDIDDSCKNAIEFGNAKIAESLVNEDYSGMIRNYRGDDTSKLDFIHFFESGKILKSVFYFENGKIQEEYSFKCGALHGEQKYYYETGILAKIIPYRYGRSNGVGKLFDNKGIL